MEFKTLAPFIPPGSRLCEGYDLESDSVLEFNVEVEELKSYLQQLKDKAEPLGIRVLLIDERLILVALHDHEVPTILQPLWSYFDRTSVEPHVVTGTAALIRVKEKLFAPDCMLVSLAEMARANDHLIGKAEVIFEMLSSVDDLEEFKAKCKLGVAKLVILLANTVSKSGVEYDEVHYFTRQGTYMVHEPEYLDLEAVLPNCRIYLCFTYNQFRHGQHHVRTTITARHELLREAIKRRNMEDVMKFTCGLQILPFGCMVQAYTTGDERIISYLLSQGLMSRSELKETGRELKRKMDLIFSSPPASPPGAGSCGSSS